MIHINKQTISSPQGVSRDLKEFTKSAPEDRYKSADLQTSKRALPPHMSPKSKTNFLTFKQP